MRTAAIGIGSNSLRMLIADIENAQLRRVLRDRAGVRVFAALDEQRNLSDAMIESVCQSLAAFVEKARGYQAQRIHIFATSAVRDARNQALFCRSIRQATGIDVDICTGEQEALLSFLGATDGQRAGMIDIGGGSTEIVIGDDHAIQFSASLQMGAVRLCRQMAINCVEDARNAVAIAENALDCLKPLPPREGLEWYGVGGTFTLAAAYLQGVPLSERGRIHGYRARIGDVYRAMETLAPMSIQQRTSCRGVQPGRADIAVHGMAILYACMKCLGIESVTVSECGNLEGYLKRRYCRR